MPLYILVLSIGTQLGIRTVRSTDQGATVPVWDQYYRCAMTSQKCACCIEIRVPLFESNHTEAMSIHYMNKDGTLLGFTHYIVMNRTMSLLETSATSSSCWEGLMDRARAAPSLQTKMNDQPVDNYAAKSLQYTEDRMAPLRLVAENVHPILPDLGWEEVDSSEESAAELECDIFLKIINHTDTQAFRLKATGNSSNVLCSGEVRGNRKCVRRWHHLRQSNHIFAETGVRVRLKSCKLPTSKMRNGVQRLPKYGATVNGSKFDNKRIGIVLFQVDECRVTYEFAPSRLYRLERILWSGTRRTKGYTRSSKQIINFNSKPAGPRGSYAWCKSMLQVLCKFIAPNYGKRKHQRLVGRLLFPLRSSVFQLLFLSVATVYLFARPMQAAQDIRGSIINGMEPCFHYTMEQSLFRMNCSVLHWQAQGYGSNTYISLSANDKFDGGGTVDNTKSYIDLSGIIDFEGIFTVKDVEVTTFNEAPVIRNVHVTNGTVASHGGFIVQKEQKYFIIDTCSSSGDIIASAGGICGGKCGLDNGEIKISNSYSTGKMKGNYAGGITGKYVGYNGGIVHITQCYSIGNIEEPYAGGICGYGAGRQDGQVYIKQSYSTGDIVSGAYNSGGIVSGNAAWNKGYVDIQECYSTGQIFALRSGGITGSWAAHEEGEVHIIDCYTRGDIDGQYAGGITGLDTGGCCNGMEDFGDVHITNTYASGIVKHVDAGGIIGSIHPDFDFQGHTIHIKYSVYNDPVIIGQDGANHLYETGNSNDLTTIRGQLYQYGGVQRWDNNIWVINGSDTLPILRFQIPSPSPSPSPTPTRTPTHTVSTTGSKTPSPTETKSPSVSITQTPSPTATTSESSSLTATATPTETPSCPSVSTTQTPSSTATTSATSSRTERMTPTKTKSPSVSITHKPSPTATTSASSSLTAPVTQTETKSPSVSPTQTSSSSVTTSETRSRTATVTPTQTKNPSVSTMQTPCPTKEATSTLTDFPGDPSSNENVVTCVKVVQKQKLVGGGGRTIKLPVQEVHCQERR